MRFLLCFKDIKWYFYFAEETYSNMCALCEKPDVCDYPDIYSGYEGALRCLTHNGGDVAWTKVIYVKRFFGLPVGVTPAVPTSENPADFRYLCPDGTKVPIDANTKPCTWAARPWQGYMTNGNDANNVASIQRVWEFIYKKDRKIFLIRRNFDRVVEVKSTVLEILIILL